MEERIGLLDGEEEKKRKLMAVETQGWRGPGVLAASIELNEKGGNTC
jgi:hypothetical protein